MTMERQKSRAKIFAKKKFRKNRAREILRRGFSKIAREKFFKKKNLKIFQKIWPQKFFGPGPGSRRYASLRAWAQPDQAQKFFENFWKKKFLKNFFRKNFQKFLKIFKKKKLIFEKIFPKSPIWPTYQAPKWPARADQASASEQARAGKIFLNFF